jgi:hypothetical protein
MRSIRFVASSVLALREAWTALDALTSCTRVFRQPCSLGTKSTTSAQIAKMRTMVVRRFSIFRVLFSFDSA